MERDFMGLSSKESLPTTKHEINNEGSKDSGFTKVSAVKWPFMNKVSAHPYMMPFNVYEEDKAKMISSGFIENMNGPNVKQPLVGGLSVTKPHPVLPISGTVAGLTEPCVKPSASASQLTMFFAGTVNVFNDITPEKAKAIMLLAGSGISAASNLVQPEVQAPSSKFASGDDGVPMSPPVNIPPSSGISSPLSVSSHTGPQSGSGSSSSDEFLAAKTSRGPTPTTSASKVETPKVVNATTMFSSAIPQARKASLARFLEKRKERVMSAAPYNLNNKNSEDAPIPNSVVAAKQG
ncbi:unnamed protein product [Trifolium pratense]|uniref:Uncharacterized protein n=1 Tax=Trifolium pratense TaxID=57577 RepID=A0ACB0LZL3_TRIPR|nr:unnamed protein product [Trifolium pratense]